MEQLKTTTSTARPGFAANVAGKRAESHGGHAIAGTRYAGRQEFAGTLSGEYVDHGDPVWRWYLLVELTQKPDGYQQDSVWCESGNLFIVREERG